jgi:hypothetical protein
MSYCNKDLNQTDQETILRDEVSDEALDAASLAPQVFIASLVRLTKEMRRGGVR